MKHFALLCRLTAMRRRAGASPLQSIAWAAGLTWRNYRGARQTARLLRNAHAAGAARERSQDAAA